MFTQDDRFLKIETPLGKDVLLLTSFRGSEAISTGFSFELNLISEDHNIDFKEIIGQKVTVTIVMSDGEERFFNGLICRFAHGGSRPEDGGDHRFSYYNATMVPWSWLLGKTSDSRVFQELSVEDIVTKILDEKGFADYAFRLSKDHPTRNYCVQYRETDLDFISRILEEEGIYYFFEHEAKVHTLVFADTPVEHKFSPYRDSVTYQMTFGGLQEEDVITTFDMQQEIRAGKYTLNDYNFTVPATDLTVSVDTQKKLGPGEREIYAYPGIYDKRDGGDRLVNLRMGAEETQITKISGQSDCRFFASGFKFLLKDYPRDDLNLKEYVLTKVEHQVSQGLVLPGHRGETEGAVYTNRFECIPHEVPYVPPQITKKPVIDGIQTAIVVGPDGEEIYTDEHARVKIQFHWDREGTHDEDSSCWVRVSQIWAGAGWGGMHIPRIDQEVVVSFVEGDPDRPLITGRVYHGNNQPPYPLPADKTKSTIKSDSYNGEGSNEIRFEDKSGEEEVYLHGQKDWTIAIENNKNQTIGNNESAKVEADRSRSVGNDETITIGANRKKDVGTDETITIGSNRKKTVGVDETISVGSKKLEEVGADQTLKVGGQQVISVGADSNHDIAGSITINAGSAIELISNKIILNATASLEIVCGGTTIKLTPDALKTGSPGITTTAGAFHEIKGAIVKHNC
jgi:type VI secretion system secreted protein VgrG